MLYTQHRTKHTGQYKQRQPKPLAQNVALNIDLARGVMNIAKLKTKAEGLVTQLTAKDDCERVVLDSISNKSWAAHPTQLNEIAEWTFQYDRWDQVSRELVSIAINSLKCLRFRR